MINGIVNIYKEEGYTSHDVVAKLRGIFKQKKIGHTGTLDPMATGVLPICLGRFTKLCDDISTGIKIYKVQFELGYETDTEDITGKVVKSSKNLVTKMEILSVIDTFIGDLKQIPPMYSAIKVNGKKLYELAREGKEINRKERLITVYNIYDICIDNNIITMTVDCSKGTYIRSLCRDIGRKLGTFATMSKLERIRVGKFDIKTAITISELEKRYANREKVILGIDEVFSYMSRIRLDEKGSKLATNGNKFHTDNIEFIMEDKDNYEYMVYTHSNEFVGIYTKEDYIMSPKLMFLVGE